MKISLSSSKNSALESEKKRRVRSKLEWNLENQFDVALSPTINKFVYGANTYQNWEDFLNYLKRQCWDCHLSQLSFVSLSQSSVNCVMIVFFLNQVSWWSSFLSQVSRLSSIECRDCPLPQSSLSTFSIKFWACLLSQSSVVMNLWTMSWVMSVDNNVSYECGWQRDLRVDNDVSHTSGWQCDKCGQRHELQVWTTWVSVNNMS